jgi:propanediol dehydratase small subunit
MTSLYSMKDLFMRNAALTVLVGLSCLSSAFAQTAATCAANPTDAWANAQAAVKSGDAGRVMLALTPEKRARESSSFAVGAHMVLSIRETLNKSRSRRSELRLS